MTTRSIFALVCTTALLSGGAASAQPAPEESPPGTPVYTPVVTQPVTTETVTAETVTPRRVERPKRHAFSVGGFAGITYWAEAGPFGTSNSVGLALVPGFNAGIRASLEVLPWLAIDGRTMVMRNAGNALVNGGSVTTFGGFVAARFIVPLKIINPYALVGVGGYRLFVKGSQTDLLEGTYFAPVIGLGAAFHVGHDVDVGAEWAYHLFINETLAKNEKYAGGDPSTISFFVQYRLPF